MGLGSRFAEWLEERQEAWKDRLRGWMASWLMRGFNELMEDMEPEAIDLLRVNLAKIVDHPATPQDMKDVISMLQAGKKPLPLLILIPLAVLMFIPVITSIFQPLGNLFRYVQERIIHSWRLDPIAVITAWRRDPEKYAGLFDDLKDQGWDDDRIEALKFLTQAYPTLGDVIRFYAREVFEPDMIKRYKLRDELPPYEGTLFEKLGVPPEIAEMYWMAHWVHANWMQVVEMLRRGQLTEEEVREWFRVVEIPPYWRDKLIAISYAVPTRVDVRRWWDMRTIDEARLREVYAWQGYHGKDLDDYVLWTKVYVAFPDLFARWSKGWITIDDVRSELTGLGMPAARVEEMIQTKIKAAQPERMAPERDLTKSEIVKGVKLEVITWGEGIERLMDLGYSEDEAEFKLTIDIAAAAGSPETPEEFRDLTQKWRKAVGMPAKPVPEELKKAAAEVVRLTKEVQSLKEAIETEEKKLIEGEVLPVEATAKRDELRVTLHRAEAELFRVKTEYDSLVAQWRHGG